MDAPFATPLLDLVRGGEAPRDVRLTAAQGGLSLRPLEQLGLLAALVGDDDADVAAAAAATLEAIPAASIAGFLARSDVSNDLRTFFAGRGVEPGEAAADIETPLIEGPPLDSSQGTAIDRALPGRAPRRRSSRTRR